MKKLPRLQLRNGWLQSLAAFSAAAGAAAVILASSWSESQTAGRLAISGVVLFTIALLLGSGLLVVLATLPILTPALITSVGGASPEWVRAAVVGILWYLAAELAWDAIERRDGVPRTAAYNNRRIDEITVVIVLSLVVTVAVTLLTGAAPARSVFILAIALVGVAAALGAATRRVRQSADGASGSGRGSRRPARQ